LISSRKLKIVVILIVIVTILQLVRLGYIVKWNELSNQPNQIYRLDQVNSRQSDLWQSLDQKNFLYIESNDSRINQANLQLLDYINAQVDSLQGDQVKGVKSFESYDLVIVAQSLWSQVDQFHNLMNYARDGGQVILFMDANSIYDSLYTYYARALGILETGTYLDLVGFEIHHGILPGIEVMRPDDYKGQAFMGSVALQGLEGMEKYMVNQEGHPVVWKVDLGYGQVGVMNLTTRDQEFQKALSLGLMATMVDNFYYPIINSKVMFIDNFPADYVGRNQRILEEYGRSTERFISEIWWPDIVTTLKRYDILYTGAFVASNTTNTSGQFNKDESIGDRDLLRYGRELFKYGGEIAFRGYNNQAFIFDQDLAKGIGGNAWTSINLIEESLETARKKFEHLYPNYSWLVYVAPKGLLDPSVKSSIEAYLPEVQIYAGVLQSDLPHGLVQTYTLNQDGTINLPRATSGSLLDIRDYITLASVVSVNGIISHSIQPDDYTDDLMSQGMTWDEIFDSYTDFLDFTREHFDWLREDKASDAGQKVAQYDSLSLRHERVGSRLKIYCENFQFDQAIILYSEKPVKAIDNCSVDYIGNNRYLIVLKAEAIEVEVD